MPRWIMKYFILNQGQICFRGRGYHNIFQKNLNRGIFSVDENIIGDSKSQNTMLDLSLGIASSLYYPFYIYHSFNYCDEQEWQLSLSR